MANKSIGVVAILSNKRTLVSHTNFDEFKKKNRLYKYLLRYLLERVSDACRRRHLRRACGDGRVRIVFSRRGGMDYADFQQYMHYLKSLQENEGSLFPLHWDCIDIDAITAIDHSRSAGLQLADIAASAFFQAVEPNLYGGYEPRYAEELRPIVLTSRDGQWINFGVKPVPNLATMPLTPEQAAFFETWKKERRTPGP